MAKTGNSKKPPGSPIKARAAARIDYHQKNRAAYVTAKRGGDNQALADLRAGRKTYVQGQKPSGGWKNAPKVPKPKPLGPQPWPPPTPSSGLMPSIKPLAPKTGYGVPSGISGRRTRSRKGLM